MAVSKKEFNKARQQRLAVKNNADRRKELKQRNVSKENAVNRKADFDFKNIFTLIGLILLLFAVVGYVTGKPPVTFAGFLEFLQTCPTFDMTKVLSIPQIATANWGVFQSLGGFINGFITILNALMFIVTCIVNAVSMILWFLQYLFL